jgi:predicted nucleic acid-binding protein
MIVVDTNIISYMVFKTLQSDKVEALHKLDPDWEVPVLWKSEFLNVVSLYFRKKILTYQEAIQAVDFAEQLVDHHEHNVSSVMILELITQSNCSSYDCEFVALAKNLSIKFITYDKQTITDFPSIAFKPEDYLAQIS